MKPAQLRARVLAEWRGLPETFAAPDRAVAVGAAVLKVMAGLGLKERLRAEEMADAWQEIVGEFVARHSTPQQLVKGVLTVRVLQPTVQFELDRFWKPKILAKLKERFGKSVVREIRFRVG